MCTMNWPLPCNIPSRLLQDDLPRAMWEQAMDEMAQRLVQRSADNLTYLAHLNVANFNTTGRVEAVMEHLACFLPGNLAQVLPS